MKVGDIVYIEGDIWYCVDTRGPNWDFRDGYGNFDYFDKKAPYIKVSSVSELEDTITQEQWNKYYSELDEYNKLMEEE